ncbi:MAG: hypothetical protein LBK54_06605 [Propionibacteriaceae bacterium]|jgi:hypothetical protein|nr:hypothetical protein [Propionibacteriaceae bacterium]
MVTEVEEVDQFLQTRGWRPVEGLEPPGRVWVWPPSQEGRWESPTLLAHTGAGGWAVLYAVEAALPPDAPEALRDAETLLQRAVKIIGPEPLTTEEVLDPDEIGAVEHFTDPDTPSLLEVWLQQGPPAALLLELDKADPDEDVVRRLTAEMGDPAPLGPGAPDWQLSVEALLDLAELRPQDAPAILAAAQALVPRNFPME